MQTYEEKLNELKKVNEQLSKTDIPLAELVSLYKKAQGLMDELKKELEESKLTIASVTEQTEANVQ